MSNPIHMMFQLSAAGSLRQWLMKAGRRERVFTPSGDYSCGPLMPDDAAMRSRWMKDVLGEVELPGAVDLTAFFSGPTIDVVAAQHDGDVVAWVQPDSAHSLSNFLPWLSRVGDRPIRLNRIVDMGSLQPAQLAAYLDSHVELGAADRADGLARWRKLVEENAAFRVLADDGLVSAPLDYFDAALLAHAGPDWQTSSRVAGSTSVEFRGEGRIQTDTLVLTARLRMLAREGALEWRGDLNDWKFEVRLPGRG